MRKQAPQNNLSSRTHRLQNELATLDCQLDELQTEQQSLEDLLWRLEKRRSQAEDEYTRQLAERDGVEGALWESQQSVPDLAVRPPDLSQFRAVPRTLDPALESWGFDATDVAPQWLPPANTWRVQVAVPAGTTTNVRRHTNTPNDGAVRTRWNSRSNTAAIWAGPLATRKA